ncbi:hypothetical protein EJD97_009786 [Solanum chilense]|uniref:Tf2-1-like SH3-like domain-containing protein n=1 Tax=Solanum chilense TaxID=4083 RepID=A0A6N2BLU2_SOLCI|nr:hypothetical protein EJD97_009786 [Solanum chilense]
MNRKRNNARRAKKENSNEEDPRQAAQNPQVLIDKGAMSNFEIRTAIFSLNQVLATNVAKVSRVQVNSNASTTSSRIRDFTRRNPPNFFGPKVKEDPTREQNLKQVSRDLKRSNPDEGNSSKTRFEIQDKPRFKKKFSNPSPSNAPKPNQGRRTAPKPQGENKSGLIGERATCANCGKKHEGRCLAGMGVCFVCRKSCHQLKDFPIRSTKGIELLKIQQMLQSPMHLRRITSMLFALGVIKRIPNRATLVDLVELDMLDFYSDHVNYLRIVLLALKDAQLYAKYSWSCVIMQHGKVRAYVSRQLKLKESILGKFNESFSQRNGVLRYQGRLCVSDVDDLRSKFLEEAHGSRHSIYPGATKICHLSILMAPFDKFYGRRCRSPVGCFEISPMKGVMRFGNKEKLSPWYVCPYEVLQRVGKVAYEFNLPSELALVNPVYHDSMVKKCLGDPVSILPIEGLGVEEDLSYEEVLVEILDI